MPKGKETSPIPFLGNLLWLCASSVPLTCMYANLLKTQNIFLEDLGAVSVKCRHQGKQGPNLHITLGFSASSNQVLCLEIRIRLNKHC